MKVVKQNMLHITVQSNMRIVYQSLFVKHMPYLVMDVTIIIHKVNRVGNTQTTLN